MPAYRGVLLLLRAAASPISASSKDDAPLERDPAASTEQPPEDVVLLIGDCEQTPLAHSALDEH